MEKFGLAVRGGGEIPLKSVTITGELQLSFARIILVQCYENNGSESIEAIYTFPIPDTAAVLGFKARTGDRTIEGKIIEREEALKVYRDAVRAGDGAVLLEQHRPNIFQVSVGRLLPVESIEIEISYLEELKCQDRELRLTIPMVVAPRYIPGFKTGEKRGPGWADPTDRVPDADFITPVIGEAGYRAALDLKAVVPPATRFESPTHGIRVDWTGENTARISFAGAPAAMDSDFILVCALSEEIGSGGVVYFKNEEEKLLHLMFLPELEPQAEPSGKTYIFMLDVSGSMTGIKLDQAKGALQLCLRNLTGADSFNVIAFNHACTRFAKRALPFNQRQLDRAGRWIEGLQASGGTEILEPFASCLEDRGSGDSIILLFTDGQVGNEREVLAFVRRRLKGRRVFTFGIDTAVNSYFLNELARIGRGRAEFVFPGERIEDKVLRQFSRIVSPAVEGARIDWGGNRVEDCYPRGIDLIFNLEPLHVFARVKGEPGGDVILRGRLRGKDGDTPFKCRLDLNGLPRSNEADLLEKAWARRVIQELEGELNCVSRKNAKKIEAELLSLSLQHGIISSLTSFVAVEERVDKAAGLPVTRPVPVSLPRGWEMPVLSRALFGPPMVAEDTLMECYIPYFDEGFPASLNDVSFVHDSGVRLQEEGAFDDAIADLLRALARKQMADGVFADEGAQDLQEKLETTALCLLAFLLGPEEIDIYLNQLRKSLRFIVEALEDGKAGFDLEREADVRLCLLVLLALKGALLRGVVRRKEMEAVQEPAGRLLGNLRKLARDSERVWQLIGVAENLQQPGSLAAVLDFLGISGSAPDDREWEGCPPSVLARYILRRAESRKAG
ncbi:MAG: VIT and VWA domain-containing protein [Bacillota bacterium]|nr:VIT and VWA domain-containing protein [Bacillota bacterium]